MAQYVPPPANTLRNWWRRHLLQYTLALFAEVAGSSIILYYKDLAIILSQSSLKALHKAFVTHVEAHRFDLVSDVDAIIAFGCSTHRLLSHNPLTAAFLISSGS